MKLPTNNPILARARGRMGDLVFRQVNGRTVVSRYLPHVDMSKRTAKQVASSDKFRKAIAFAALSMKDPERKAYYTKKAETLNLPNAMQAAVTDYMRRGGIGLVRRFPNDDPNMITVFAEKDGFLIRSVFVGLVTKTGEFIEGGQAEQTNDETFKYKVVTPMVNFDDVVIRVSGIDTDGTVVTTDALTDR